MTIFTLWFLPQMLFYGFTALATALLNAHRRFVAAAFAPGGQQRDRDRRARRVRAQHRRIARRSGSTCAASAATPASSRCSARAPPPGIAAMALVLLPALRNARARLRARLRLAPSRRAQDAAAVGMDDRLRRHEPDRAAVRARARQERRRPATSRRTCTRTPSSRCPHGLLAVSIMTTMMPELSRSAAQRDFAGLAYRFRVGLRYLRPADAPGRGAVHRARAADARRARARRLPAARRRGHRRHAAGAVDRARAVLGVPLHAARLLRAARHAHAVLDQRDRERRSTSCSRSRCSRRSACRASRWHGAAPTRSPRSIARRRAAPAGPAPGRPGGRLHRRFAPRSATVVLAIVAAALAAAIGHATANRALARDRGGRAGGRRAPTSSCSSLLRTPELGSLVGSAPAASRSLPTIVSPSGACNHGPFATDRNYPDPRRSHGRSRRDRQCL